MKKPIQKITLLLIGLFCTGLLTACDTLMQAANDAIAPLNQLEKACHQQAVEKAGAYDAAAGKTHLVAIFQRNSADEESYSLNTSVFLPTGWAVETEETDPTTIELVACVTRLSEELVETCEYEIEEGTNNTYYLDVYDTTYEVKLFAATSGEELGSTTLEKSLKDVDDPCPSSYMFTEGITKENYYARADDKGLEEFLGQYVKP